MFVLHPKIVPNHVSLFHSHICYFHPDTQQAISFYLNSPKIFFATLENLDSLTFKFDN